MCTFFIGLGQVSISRLFFQSSSQFFADPPVILLTGRSIEGPPTNSLWKRNGFTITNDDSFQITLITRCDIRSGCLRGIYDSNLRVTGYLPGHYQYFVSNEATTSVSIKSIRILG